MREVALLERLGLPAVETWLTTFDWLYGAFSKTMTCTITSGIREADDTEVVTYLEQIFSEAEKTLDPTSEYETQIDVQAISHKLVNYDYCAWSDGKQTSSTETAWKLYS